MSTTEPTTATTSTEASPECRIFVWPLDGRYNRAVIMHTDPSATVITEFILTGENAREKLKEMRRWVAAHQGFDLKLIEEKVPAGDWAAEGTDILGFTFTVPASDGWAWWSNIRSI